MVPAGTGGGCLWGLVGQQGSCVGGQLAAGHLGHGSWKRPLQELWTERDTGTIDHSQMAGGQLAHDLGPWTGKGGQGPAGAVEKVGFFPRSTSQHPDATCPQHSFHTEPVLSALPRPECLLRPVSLSSPA